MLWASAFGWGSKRLARRSNASQGRKFSLKLWMGMPRSAKDCVKPLQTVVRSYDRVIRRVSRAQALFEWLGIYLFINDGG